MLPAAGVARSAHRPSAYRAHRLTVVVALGFVAVTTARGGAGEALSVTAAYDVIATGFENPSGLAVDRDGSVLVTDRRAGTLTRIAASGARQVILADLRDPRGVAATADGVFVLEGGTRVLRLEPAGSVSPVSVSLTRAWAIAAGPDGRIWVASRRGGDQSLDDAIVRLDPSGATTPFASGLTRIRAIAVDRVGIYAVADAVAGETISRPVLARFRWRANGSPGPVEPLVRSIPGRPRGVAIDAAGEVFMTSSWLQSLFLQVGVVLKRRAGGEVGLFTSALSRPGAAAFGPGRDLFVIERRTPARVVRFRPPPPPVVNLPGFTNATPLPIAGHAQPGSLVHVRASDATGRVLAAGRADMVAGAFVLNVPLAANAATKFSLVATSKGGDGLVGLPAPAAVVHDDHLPLVEILEPLAGTHVRAPFVFVARAEDEASGTATLRLMLDQAPGVAAPIAAQGGPLEGSMVIDTTALPEGPHALAAEATDRAGNLAATARLVVVDRTPPETSIVASPPAETADRSAMFALEGPDEQSADVEFAWRLDRGSWSEFTTASIVRLADLGVGEHYFEAVARDRAGNVDPSPAAQTFLINGLRVRILEPLPGTVVTTQTVWVRGTVEGADVTVSVPLAEAFRQQLRIDALPAPYEAGAFAVEVPVVEGIPGLTVVARDGGGGQSSETIPITVLQPLSRPLRLESSPAAGLAPLGVRFSASSVPRGSVYSLDLDSDGRPEEEGEGLPQREFVYAQPGVHVATLKLTTPDGQVLVARGSIEVYDRARLETQLRSEWGSFKAAMRAADPAVAASFVHRDRRAAWAEYFARLTPAQFAATEVLFTDLTLVAAAPGRVECDMLRDEGGLLYSFPVSFELDGDGGWKLWQF